MATSIYEDYARTSATRDGRVTIYVDSESDIANLSTDYAPGSKVYVVDGSSNGVYVLSPSGTWTAMPSSGGGGGGGGGASVLVVNVTEDAENNYVCDKTAAEMWASVPLVCFKYKMGDADVIRCLYQAGHAENRYMFADYENQFEATSGTDYPTATSPI